MTDSLILGHSIVASLYEWNLQMGDALRKQNEWALVRLKLQVKAGSVLIDVPRGKPGKAIKVQPVPYFKDVIEAARITKRQAREWQQLAEYYHNAPEDWQRIIDYIDASDYELSTTAMLRRANAYTELNNEGLGIQKLDEYYPIQYADIVPILHRLRDSGADTWNEISNSGYLQPGDEEDAIPIWELTEAKLTKILRQRQLEHIAETQVSNGRVYIYDGQCCTPEILDKLYEQFVDGNSNGKVLRIVAWVEDAE